MIVYKNLTLHKITLAETVEGVEIVEPIYDKSALIVNTDEIDKEFDRILGVVAPYIYSGDKVIVGGHPLVCQAIITACIIKGAVPYMTKINEFRQVFYFYKVKTYFDIDRRSRLMLENTDIL